MWVCKYFIFFVEFSFLGWVWESIYCAYAHKKWCNRGFLYGPICPIYGVACVLGIALLEYIDRHNLPMLKWWQTLLLAMAVSAILEYAISFTLEKLFHARWWDYSNVPLNINGRVSLPTACGFGVGGLFVMYIVAPEVIEIMSSMNGILAEFLALIVMAALGSDVTLTVNTMTDFLKEMEELDEAFHTHMTEVVEDIYARKARPSRWALHRVRKFSMPQRIKKRGLTRPTWEAFSNALLERFDRN